MAVQPPSFDGSHPPAARGSGEGPCGRGSRCGRAASSREGGDIRVGGHRVGPGRAGAGIAARGKGMSSRPTGARRDLAGRPTMAEADRSVFTSSRLDSPPAPIASFPRGSSHARIRATAGLRWPGVPGGRTVAEGSSRPGRGPRSVRRDVGSQSARIRPVPPGPARQRTLHPRGWNDAMPT